MKTRVKGNRIVRKCIEQFFPEKDGFSVARVERGGKFVQEKDAFGLFDLLAVGKEHVQLIQVTCNRPHSHKKYVEFCKKHHPSGLGVHQFVWYDRQGWVGFSYDSSGYDKYEGRKDKIKERSIHWKRVNTP